MYKVVSNNYMNVLLGRLRNVDTKSFVFSKTMNEISYFMVYEMLKDLEMKNKKIKIWNDSEIEVKDFDSSDFIIVPVLRAGVGMLEAVRKIFSNSTTHMLGLCRNEETLKPVWYYNKLPENLTGKKCIILDPMLATSGTIADTVKVLKGKGVEDITVFSVIASEYGVNLLLDTFPKLKIYIASLDKELDKNGYIIPGLGDAGDRLFNS